MYGWLADVRAPCDARTTSNRIGANCDNKHSYLNAFEDLYGFTGHLCNRKSYRQLLCNSNRKRELLLMLRCVVPRCPAMASLYVKKQFSK